MREEGTAEGAWIFLSHSHKDLEKVRRIRNALEEKGHNPLLFFLKCMDDDSSLDGLIRREIEARTWFILCDSPHARVSRWVQEEVEMIKVLEGKVYEEIDLDGELEQQIERVTALSKRATVFLSYAREDRAVAELIAGALRANDFRVFDEQETPSASNWQETLAQGVDEALEQGFFLALLSPDAVDKEMVREEISYALKRKAAGASNVIPVIVGDLQGTHDALKQDPTLSEIVNIQFVDLTATEFGDLRTLIGELVRDLKARPS